MRMSGPWHHDRGKLLKKSHDTAVIKTEQAQRNVLPTFDFVASVTSSDSFILRKIQIMVGTHSCSLSLSSAFPSSSLWSNIEMIKCNCLKYTIRKNINEKRQLKSLLSPVIGKSKYFYRYIISYSSTSLHFSTSGQER